MPLAARGPQVVMNTRNRASDGAVAVADFAPIFASQEVRQLHAYLLKQHGADAMVEAERQRDRLLDEMTALTAHLMRTAMADRRVH